MPHGARLWIAAVALLFAVAAAGAEPEGPGAALAQPAPRISTPALAPGPPLR